MASCTASRQKSVVNVLDNRQVNTRRLGRASARAVPVDEVLQMVTPYETCYTGWTVKHFHERWHQEHGGTRSYTWTKSRLHAAGHVTRAPRRGAHRKKRPRKPLPGMMLHPKTGPGMSGCRLSVGSHCNDG
jgi:hypothetical protein